MDARFVETLSLARWLSGKLQALRSLDPALRVGRS